MLAPSGIHATIFFSLLDNPRSSNPRSKSFVMKILLIGVQNGFIRPINKRARIAKMASCPQKSEISQAQSILDRVYGEFLDEETWKPRPYGKFRYLWTDAFGVCAFLTLFLETGRDRYLVQAAALIDATHEELGRERPIASLVGQSQCPPRLGSASESNPTLAGLRIGKVLDEGAADGDGQYFHYNTKWAYALNSMSLATKEKKYNDWAIELLQTSHAHFVDRRRLRMHWKVSIDMKRPLVQSEGNLDPFDGLVSYQIVADTAKKHFGADPSVLKDELAEFKIMVERKYQSFDSFDPLDLGEALWLAHWSNDSWADVVSHRSESALNRLWEAGYFHQPLKYRLAFREFGTTLGLQCNTRPDKSKWTGRIEQIHKQWKDSIFHRDADITPVMHVASILSGGGVWKKGYIEKNREKTSAPHKEE